MKEGLEKADEGLIRELADRYRIRLETLRMTGAPGIHQGRETGASVEIQDFRPYAPGDDPRRIDWFSFARSGDLIVRLFREEISPFFDVIVDGSSSMAIRDGRKESLTREMLSWLRYSALASGLTTRFFKAGSDMTRLDDPREITFDASECSLFSEPRNAAALLRRASVRLILSDFMTPLDVPQALKAIHRDCSRLIVIRLLGPWEAHPDPIGPVVLKNVEDDRQANLTLDQAAVKAYLRRLETSRSDLAGLCIRLGGLHVELAADRTLESVLRNDLMPLGLVEVV